MTTSPTILITGATDGLGRALAHHLAAVGAVLILHGRDPGKLERAADDIRDAHHAARPRTVLADLADLSQVRQMAAGVQQHTDRLDVLVSNAGIGSGEPDGRTRRTSADAYELRFAVNYRRVPAHPGPALAAAQDGSRPHRQRRVDRPASARLRRPHARTPIQRHPRVRSEQARPDHVGLRAR